MTKDLPPYNPWTGDEDSEIQKMPYDEWMAATEKLMKIGFEKRSSDQTKQIEELEARNNELELQSRVRNLRRKIVTDWGE